MTTQQLAATLLLFFIFVSGGAWAGGEALAAAPATEEPQEDFSSRIIWIAEQPEKPRFIPESQLQEDQRLRLPINEGLEFLLQRAEAVQSAHGESLRKATVSVIDRAHCSVSSESSTGDPTSLDIPMIPFLQRGPFVVKGEVVETVSGWASFEVQTLVYARVTSILWCRARGGRSVTVGDVIAVALRRGLITVDGSVLCNATDSVAIPAPGDHVILSAYPEQGYRHYAGLGLIFPIEDGRVMPQPYSTRLMSDGPQLLDEVVQNLEPRTPSCGG